MPGDLQAVWHLWSWRDGAACDLGIVGCEAGACAAAARANEHQRTKGLATLGVRFEAHPAGWEPVGHGRVPGLPKSREEKWPAKPVLWWRDDLALPLFLREGKTERRDARLAPALERAERERLSRVASGPAAPSKVALPQRDIPAGLAALNRALRK